MESMCLAATTATCGVLLAITAMPQQYDIVKDGVCCFVLLFLFLISNTLSFVPCYCNILAYDNVAKTVTSLVVLAYLCC